MSLTVFTNAFLIDCTGADPVEGAAVVVEDDRIKEVAANGRVGALPGPVTTHDLKGATLMPGLTDAHVHFFAVTENITDQHRYLPPSLLVAKALKRAEECLMQGFTTVRDAGGADYGLREALAEGLFPGPRLLVSGNYLSQTGGHGDKRRRSEWIEPVGNCCGMVGIIADGEAEVRKAFTQAHCKPMDWATDAADRRCDAAAIQFGGVDARITFFLKNDAVQAFDLRFDDKDLRPVVEYLRERYGRPDMEGHETFRRRGDARSVYKVRWEKGADRAVLSSIAGRRRVDLNVWRGNFDTEIYRLQ